MLNITPVKFEKERLFFLDQTLLPGKEEYIEVKTKEDVWEAIHKLKVRGAPAIGVAAAYGLYIASAGLKSKNERDFLASLCDIKEYLASSRPTAVNLFWALGRMMGKAELLCTEMDNIETWDKKEKEIRQGLLSEAESIMDEDIKACMDMGEYGLQLLEPGMGILTHCNAGTIATSRYGTCLAPIHMGEERGYGFKVFADETRPLLQGSRLTAWELDKAGVDVTLICDNMAASVMKQGKIDAVVVGCDRMAANGDGANKIGTMGVAVLAKEFNIPFYMFVPTSTIDLGTAKGDDIKIEEREGSEIYEMWFKKPMAPKGIKTYNPAFDVTDHSYITAVITEKGIVRPPFDENLKKII